MKPEDTASSSTHVDFGTIVMYGGSSPMPDSPTEPWPIDPWPPRNPPVSVMPSIAARQPGLPRVPEHLRAAVTDGVGKLLDSLRPALSQRAAAGQPLDADEATALAWLEGLASAR